MDSNYIDKFIQDFFPLLKSSQLAQIKIIPAEDALVKTELLCLSFLKNNFITQLHIQAYRTEENSLELEFELLLCPALNSLGKARFVEYDDAYCIEASVVEEIEKAFKNKFIQELNLESELERVSRLEELSGYEEKGNSYTLTLKSADSELNFNFELYFYKENLDGELGLFITPRTPFF